MDAIAEQVAVAKLTAKEVHDQVMAMGVSDLDAGLVADCINEKLASFIKENGYGFEITVSPVRMDKYIWDVKKRR